MSGTYLAVKPTALSLNDIKKIQLAINIQDPIPKEEIHCTLMASKEKTGSGYSPNPDIVYSASVTGCDILGEKGSGWQALILKLHCPALQRRFNLAKHRGMEHSYPEFLPHVSLAYEKDNDLEGYLVELREYLQKSPQLTIELSYEYMEPFNDTWIEDEIKKDESKV
jgi:hypothetical protein